MKERDGEVADLPSFDKIKFSKEHSDVPLLPACEPPLYKQATFDSFMLSVEVPNNCCMIDSSVIIVESFARLRGMQVPCIIGREFKVKENLYEKPFISGTIDVFVVS